MKNSDESTSPDVERLLQCFRRGLSPLPRGKASQVSCGSRSLIRTLSTDMRTKAYECLRSSNEDMCSTPESKNKPSKSFTKEVTPGVFYGSPIGKPSKKPPQVLCLLNEIRRDLAAEGDLWSRTTIWATFSRQDQAVQFKESHGNKDITVFTYQDHYTEQRRFLVTSYEEFWHRYKSMSPQYRHHYEIISEGSPCHLYFDLEFNRAANKEINGDRMVDVLLLKIGELIHDVYSLEYDPSWTIELDSTTEEKFSRHVIIRMPKAAFKDNSHVGAFVGELCKRLDKLRDDDEKVNQLYVLKGQSRGDCHSQLFLDQAVYSRNRSFRLPFSSKAGKTSLLFPSGRFHCKEMSDYEIFMDSLICRVDNDCERFLTFGSEMAGCGGSVPVGYTSSVVLNRLSKVSEFGIAGISPFSALDAFIESIACVGGIPGKIRSWYWFSEYGVILYNMTGNRFCENIGRHHKSNHVMYIVDFRIAGYYQKCHDPDCRGYKSPLRPIPRHTIPPNFPLSSAFESQNVTAEKLLKSSKHEECSADILSRLSIANEDTNVTDCGFCEILPSGNNCKLEDYEESWWKEAVKSVENVEKELIGDSVNHQCGLPEVFTMDENWWKLVEQETLKLEAPGL